MASWFLRILIVSAISVGAGSIGVTFSIDYFNTMFTVIGIMFSIALSQILAFSFSGVTNDDFVKQHRTQLLRIQNTFIILFAFATIFFLLSSRSIKFVVFKIIVISPECFFGCFDIFFLCYFTKNFLGLVTLKNEIDDLIRKSE